MTRHHWHDRDGARHCCMCAEQLQAGDASQSVICRGAIGSR